jgi:hypothetical protein
MIKKIIDQIFTIYAVLLIIMVSIPFLYFFNVDLISIIEPMPDDNVNGLRYRWVFIDNSIETQEKVQNIMDIMLRAKQAGYNGVVLGDFKIEILDKAPADYIKNLQTIKDYAHEIGLETYPVVLSVGYGTAFLSYDPNLAEGFPVKDAVFIARSGEADVLTDPDIILKNGDFESYKADTFSEWNLQDDPGKKTFSDDTIKHSGESSIRMTASGNCRVAKVLNVKPFRSYHLSIWIKTEGVKNPDGISSIVIGNNINKDLAYPKWDVSSTQEWKKYDLVFNSLNNTKVLLYIGTWDGKGGSFWLDDASIEETGLTNIIRRDVYPLIVKDENGTIYVEGQDFEEVKDPLLGKAPMNGSYDMYHKGPTIKLTQNSRIVDGTRLFVSYYHVFPVYGSQVSVSLTDPKSKELFRKQIISVKDFYKPLGYYLNYDEIRAGNWGIDAKTTEGKLIADSISENIDMIHSISPKAKIFVWSDMFDPYHNSIDNYYLVNGTVDGSYEGLNEDVIIINWNFQKDRKDTIQFFADRNNKMILAGFYDTTPEMIEGWLADASEIENANIIGVMYTTWENDYDHLEEFARSAWGADEEQT